MRQRHYFLKIDCRLVAVLLAVSGAIQGETAFAQKAEDPVIGSGTGTKAVTLSDDSFRPGGGPGLIIISRDFGPRNALTPEVGRAHTVQVVPDVIDSAFDGAFAALSDGQVAEVSSGASAVTANQSSIQAPLEMLTGNDNIRSENAGGAGGGGGISGVVTDAIGQGMGALTGALGGLSGMTQ